MDNSSPDRAERDKNVTRESPTNKVAAIEQQVVGTIPEATSTEQDAMSSVRQSVSHAKDSVLATFDAAGRVREHPWATVGGAAAAGFLVGYLIRRSARPTPGHARPKPEPEANVATTNFVRGDPPVPPAHCGVIDELIAIAQREARSLGEQVLVKLRGSLEQNLCHGIESLARNAGQLIGQGFRKRDCPEEYVDDDLEGAAHAHNGRGPSGSRG